MFPDLKLTLYFCYFSQMTGSALSVSLESGDVRGEEHPAEGRGRPGADRQGAGV